MKPYTFLPIPRLLDLIPNWDKKVEFYAMSLADRLESEGYNIDADIVRNHIKLHKGEDVAMAVQDSQNQRED